MVDDAAATRLRSTPGRLNSCATMNSAPPIGITDCVNCVGTLGRLTIVSPCRISSTCTPNQVSSAKKPITQTSPKSTAGTRQRGVSALTRPGKPMCARFSAASAAP
jgi:hypothetical protein